MQHRFLHYSMALLMQLFISAGGLAIPLLATQLGFSDLELGIVGSAGAATYVLIVVSAGALSDKLGRKKVIISGSVLTGLTYMLMPLSREPIHLIVLMAVCGCGMASFWPVLEAWLSEEGDADQVRRGLGGFNVSWSIGAALGPFLGGLLYTKSIALAFMFAAGGTCVVAFLALLHRKPMYAPHIVSCDTENTAAENGPITVERSLLYAVWMANFAGWFAMSEIRMLFPKLGLHLGMEPWLIGILVFILGVALTAMFFVMGAWGWWHNKRSPLLGAQVLIILLLLATAIVDSAAALGVVFIGIGAGMGVTYSYSLYYSVVGSLNKGAASGRHEMVLGIGALLGPFMGGAAAEIFLTQRAPYVLGAGLIAASVIAQIIMFSRSRGRGKQNMQTGPL